MFLFAFVVMIAMGASAQMNVWEDGGLSAQYAIESVDSVTFGITSETPSSGTGKDGITPLLKIENDYWFISYDEGVTWQQEGKAKGEKGDKGDQGIQGVQGETGPRGEKGDKGDSMFQAVTQDSNFVYLTLLDSTIVKLVKAREISNNDQPNEEFLFTISYDPNGGEGIMLLDTFYYGVAKKIQKNTFTINTNKIYIEWNTKPDGTGVAYQEDQEVIINKNIKLYAIWKIVHDDKFSISDNQKVCFSKGNLQYQASTNQWRFAENQYDFIGDKNAYISTFYTGWIDLFGWGTGNNPTLYTRGSDDYQVFTDWGCNKIDNDPAYTWRTLTYAEWNYLIAKRTNASKLYCLAKVGETNGLIILPDCWITPHGFSLTTGSNISYEEQCFTLEQWEILESAGAIFLPAGGLRGGYSSNVVCLDIVYKNHGCYWSASHASTAAGYDLTFTSNSVKVGENNHRVSEGLSVRLVKDVE